MEKSMWVQTLTGPSEFELRELSAKTEDDLGDGEVLLRNLAGGICGSDLPFFRGATLPGAQQTGRPYSNVKPGFPLHEIVGEVVASRDRSFAVGARVVGWASNMDALSEFVVVRGASLLKYGKDLTPTTAIQLQTLACVIYALEQVRDIEGSSAAVLGLGPIGVLFSHVLRTRGAKSVVGVDRVDRSDVAKAFRIDESIQATAEVWSQSLTEEQRPNLIVEAIGHQVTTLVNAVDALAFGGQIYYFGIPDDAVYPFPMMGFLRKNARLTSGFTPASARHDVLVKAEAHLRQFPELTEAYVTNIFSYQSAQEAFDVAASPSKGRLKVVFDAAL
jgi:threonine dehydrogenase-like Zn-dependent dehydrogenase